jgi:3-oxoadipate enol-lactonase
MPTITVNGVDLRYEETGRGERTLLFAHGLLCSSAMFRRQMDLLGRRYRCIAFDFRCHGGSAAPPGECGIGTLCEDVAELIRLLVGGPCDYLGHSMGGFVGLNLALRRPDVVRSLTLINTTAEAETRFNVVKYGALAFLARHAGLTVATGPVMGSLFGPRFRENPANAAVCKEWRGRLMANDPAGVLRAVEGVVRRTGVLDRLDELDVPTLILAGADDVVTRPVHSRRMHEHIRGSDLHVLPGVGHFSAVEAPELVGALIERFLAALPFPVISSPDARDRDGPGHGTARA